MQCGVFLNKPPKQSQSKNIALMLLIQSGLHKTSNRTLISSNCRHVSVFFVNSIKIVTQK